jgi:hypothetical protein
MSRKRRINRPPKLPPMFVRMCDWTYDRRRLTATAWEGTALGPYAAASAMQWAQTNQNAFWDWRDKIARRCACPRCAAGSRA